MEQVSWWQRGIIYQIYPRSFLDTNGDGIGDLPGIINKLDYLRWLGVDAIWISPIYPSPMADFGYDISDHTGVHPIFGTLADIDRLISEAHQRNLKVILDYVPNHTSDEHPWFVESRSSRDNPKRDWYIWRDPAPGGGTPNNWQSLFEGNAWEFDPRTGQYYLHTFLIKQPDLNWRNTEMRAAMLDILRFWFDRGVDGFRIDAYWVLMKDEQFRDNPPNPAFDPSKPRSPFVPELLPVYTMDLPEMEEITRTLRGVADAYEARVLIGEIYLPIERLVRYYGKDGDGLHLPYNFQLLLLPWEARTIARAIDTYEAALPQKAWPNWVLGNHDRPRVAARVGREQARVAALLLLTLRGTPTIYYGDEIGMTDVPVPPDRVQDPVARTRPEHGGRDPQRTPMQWDAGTNAGFTSGEPWLPLAGDYTVVNVAAQRDDPTSMLTLHRRLIDLRQAHEALAIGSYAPVPAEGDLLAYVREHGEERFMVVANLGGDAQRFPSEAAQGRIVLSTHLDRDGERVRGQVELRANEAVVIAVG